MALDAALPAWQAALGAAFATAELAQTRPAEQATFATDSRVLAVLRPGSVEEVQAAVRIAAEHSVPVHPISRGRNQGYGSRVPPRDAAVLSLDRLDWIHDHDASLGTLRVEPGVSFVQAQRLLVGQGRRWHLTPPGSGGDASVLGNALQRGLIAGPRARRADTLSDLEGVLADGTVHRIGSPGIPGDWGPGPDLRGLFLQSGLGVVTAATVALAPTPPLARLLRVIVAAEADLAPLVEVLRPLRRHGILDEAGVLLDAARVEGSGGEPEGAWQGQWALSAATPDLLRARGNAALSALGDVATVRLGPVGDGGPFYAFDPPHSLDLLYGPKGGPPPGKRDPDRDRCGALWCAPVLPLRGADVAHAVRICADAARPGLHLSRSLQLPSARTALVTTALVYDRDTDGLDEVALQAFRALEAALHEAGWPPYRPGVQGRARPSPLLVRLRQSLDPNRVFA